jgi:hypothetical protein
VEVVVEERRAPEGAADVAPRSADEASRDDELRVLMDALESADDLDIDERLALLRRAEEAIARSLEGLDGL